MKLLLNCICNKDYLTHKIGAVIFTKIESSLIGLEPQCEKLLAES